MRRGWWGYIGIWIREMGWKDEFWGLGRDWEWDILKINKMDGGKKLGDERGNGDGRGVREGGWGKRKYLESRIGRTGNVDMRFFEKIELIFNICGIWKSEDLMNMRWI